MLNLPIHLEDKISTIREAKDMSTMNLDKLYTKLKTYELELEQRKKIYWISKLTHKCTLKNYVNYEFI